MQTVINNWSPLSSGVTGRWWARRGGRVFPPGNFCRLIGKNEAGEKKQEVENIEDNEENGNGKEENKEKRKQNKKMKEENEKCKGKRTENSWGPFFFLLFTFRKPLKLFFGSTKMEISTRKRLKLHREKIGKSDFAVFFFCYAPDSVTGLSLWDTLRQL